VSADLTLTLLIASTAAFLLALLSAVAGFGGGVLLLPVFTVLFGLRFAVPMLTLTQLSSNGSRLWLNRHDIRWPLVGWFAVGAVPLAVTGALLLTHAPLSPLKRVLGAFLIAVVAWRALNPHPAKPHDRTFIGVGAASGLGSALLGSVGPLTAPFFLAYGDNHQIVTVQMDVAHHVVNAIAVRARQTHPAGRKLGSAPGSAASRARTSRRNSGHGCLWTGSACLAGRLVQPNRRRSICARRAPGVPRAGVDRR
jgi:uncharacterized membrane protein YfcA